MSENNTAILSQKGSLVRRMVMTALVTSSVLLLIGAIALTMIFRQTVLSDIDDRLEGDGVFLSVSLNRNPDRSLSLTREPPDTRFEQILSGRYWQIDEIDINDQRDITVGSRSLGGETISIPDWIVSQALGDPGTAVRGEARGPDQEPLRVSIKALYLEDDASPVLITSAEDSRPAGRRIRNFALVAASLFTGFAISLVAGILLQVRVGLEPVLRIGRAVADVRDGATERVSGEYPAELIPLAGELNALLDHSREVVERSRTHVGNLAHALKTPITVLTNEARINKGPLADLVSRQAESMSAQVEHHLRRARAAANAKAIGARTSVDDVLGDISRMLTRIHERDGVHITQNIEPGLVFRGERQDFEDLAGNLMENACKWTSGQVEVIARAISETEFELVISDDGPGINEEARQQALARGGRLDEQSPGTGLGLAIVSDLARAYEGELSLERSNLGGLKACLRLPRSRRSA